MPATNPLLADPSQNPFRPKPPLPTDRPMRPSEPAGTNRPFSYGDSAAGENNLRSLLAKKGVRVGKGAVAAGGGKLMRWRDLAAAAGIKDYKGFKKDPRTAQLQDAFYGHNKDNPFGAALQSWTEGGGADAVAAGGPGGPGLGPGGPGGGPGGGPPRNFEGELEGFISDVVGGKQGPMTDDVVTNQKGGAFDEFAGGLTAKNRAEAARARRSGNLYSASTGSAMRENENAGRQALGEQFRGIENEQVKQNFGARMQALDQGLNKLKSDRELAMASAKDATDRERIAKEYDAAINTTQMKISSEEKLAQSAQGAAGRAAGQGRTWDLEDEMRRRNWALEDRAYEENWRLYDAGLSADTGY